MRAALKVWVGIGACLPALLPASAARASGVDREPLRVEYEAPTECPDSAHFEERLFRAANARRADAADVARDVLVRIVKTPVGYEGRLSVREGDDESSPRVVTSRTCPELTEALALVASLAVDPELVPDLEPEPAPAPPPPSPRPPALPAPIPEPVLAPPTALPRAAPRAPWRVSAGVDFELAWWRAAVPAFGLFVGVERRMGEVLWPSLRLSVTRSLPATARFRQAEASLAWTTVSAAACPMGYEPVATLVARPCLGAQLGAVTADPSRIQEPVSRTRPWGALDLLVRLGWTPHRRFGLELEGGLAVPWTREAFVLDPDDARIYRSPAAVGLLRLGSKVIF